MRGLVVGVGLGLAALSAAQNVEKMYNRDTEESFKLKGVKVERTVIGPIVRTSTVMTFKNPYKKLTEASLWFGLPDAAALSGFAYYYGDEYVRGRLMDKAKAWFIYTAITSRNEDPGIMDQWTPTEYHAQIYPLKRGHDLRVRLYTVGLVQPGEQDTKLPQPVMQFAPEVPIRSFVRMAGQSKETKVGNDFALLASTDPVQAVCQEFKDGNTYVAGVVKVPENTDPSTVTVTGLNEVKTTFVSDRAVAFMGWAPKNGPVRVQFKDQDIPFQPEMIHKGPEAARLWAQQKLATWTTANRDEVLRFSLQYGVPSKATALLAVPKAQMKLFNAKEKQFQKLEAQKRQAQLERARQKREWAKDRPLNWNNSSGGDPEIRVSFPNANKVEAVLPDGRRLALKESDGFWGTNFDIPADAPEGSYDVRLLAQNRDRTQEERKISHRVDRTAPKGKLELRTVDGHLRVEVRSEAGLAQVVAWLADGAALTFKEVEPGLYRLDLPDAKPIRLVVTLTDRASNKGRLECSWAGSPPTQR